MQKTNEKTGAKIAMLVMLITIEVMGIGIVFPLLPELFIAKASPLLALTTSVGLRHLFYGLAIALWPMGMFFGTPYMGLLSDKYGRKRIFLICLSMTSLSYIFLALAIYIHSLILFMVTRLLAGMFAGSYEIAQASAADLSTPETKARNMGWITFSMSIGLILGPLIASFTADARSVLSFGISTPFWIASSLSFINAVWIYFAFSETFTVKKEMVIKFRKIFSSFLFVFTDKRIQKLTVILFLLTVGWMGFFTALPLYLASVFNFKINMIGFYYALVAVGCVISIIVVMPVLLKRFLLYKVVAGTAFCCAIFFTAMLLVSGIRGFTVFLLLCAMVEIIAYSGFLALLSNTVGADEQGKTMGGSAATGSLAFMSSSFLTAILSSINPKLPILMAAVLFFLVGIGVSFYKKID